jgi:peptide deformylase
MKRQIITDISFLKQKSVPVRPEEIKEIIGDLEDTLAETKSGIGLSGVQIGILKQVAIIRIDRDTQINLINAYITDKEYKFRHIGEGCLSFPALKIDTIRYNAIRYVSNGEEKYAEGLLAVAIQHEADHLNGVTMLDRKWKAR